jgi:transcriptional regulator with XRE-family HTH domain
MAKSKRSKADSDLVRTLRAAVVAAGPHYTLAKKAGVATAVVSRFARAERSIGLETAAKLAGALGMALVERKNG